MKTAAHLLRDTFEAAVADDRFGARFYRHLFAAHPELQELFTRNSSGAQSKMFAQKLAAIVDSVFEPQRLEEEIRAIASTHATYGVRPEMYDWVGDALLAALQDSVGAEWTPEAENTWRDAYAAITKSILASPR